MKTMYVGTLIGGLLAFFLIGLVLGSLELKILLPIFVGLFAGNAIASWLGDRKKRDA